MSKSGKARSKRSRTRKRPAITAVPSAPQGAETATPAFLESKEEEAAADAEASVEDPLQDWPETESEKDRWLLERDRGADESPDR